MLSLAEFSGSTQGGYGLTMGCARRVVSTLEDSPLGILGAEKIRSITAKEMMSYISLCAH